MANTPTIFAGIDLGSNSFRLLIAATDQGRITPVYKGLDIVRLGQRLTKTGSLETAAMVRAFKVLTTYRELLSKHIPQGVRACGTAALRQADNRDFFLKQASAILGTEVQVINGDEEAILALCGALNQLPDLADSPILLVDTGCGSTELIYKNDRNLVHSIASLPLGAINLTETFLKNSLPLPAEIAAMETHIISLLAPWLNKLDLANRLPLIIATGGTATALATLASNLSSYNAALIQGYDLTISDLKNTMSMLQNLDPAARNKLPGLDCGRGEIILGGAAILHTILKLCKAKSLTVSDAGLLEGILLSAAQASQGGIP
ncbi:MAG: hypothetical protein A2511_01240 [Deltaproteobacteria bacterium RIFOXYD12_FULL_50_9]|nr:MAG: hypothetical protein A2511_01240 [Deltaproteobacteria bacterium RIFOXYD12_FULL_50_9]